MIPLIRRHQDTIVVLCIVLVTGWVTSVLSNGSLLFGSKDAGWYYPRVRWITPEIAVRAIVSAIFVLAIECIASHQSKRHKHLVLLVIFLLGMVYQLTLYAGSPLVLTEVIISDGANPYYNITNKYSLYQLLSQYAEIAQTAPVHIGANMPGKVLLYYGFRMFTDSPMVIGILVSALSTFGGVCLYWLVKQVTGKYQLALLSFIFYLILPSRIFFTPLLNSVSPVFAILPLLAIQSYIASCTRKQGTRQTWAFLYGLSIFSLLFFEPMTLTTGIIHGAFLVRAILNKFIKMSDVCVLGAYTIVTVFVMSTSGAFFTGFDPIDRYGVMVQEARTFNTNNFRDYYPWVVQNLVDFSIASGLPFTMLTVAGVGAVTIEAMWRMRSLARFARDLFVNPLYLFVVFPWLMVGIMNLLGIVRGEVARLWVFAGVFVAVGAAMLVDTLASFPLRALVIGMTVVQTVLLLSVIRF